MSRPPLPSPLGRSRQREEYWGKSSNLESLVSFVLSACYCDTVGVNEDWKMLNMLGGV